MKAYNLDHVAIAVRDLDAALAGYRTRYGIEALHREVVADQGVEEAMLALGGSFVQLITPVDDEGPVARFLDKRGEGLHHVAFAVLDLEVALAHLKSKGSRLIDREPRRGGRGTRIAFVHPSDLSGTLIELVEHDES
jgi:methylmalonyl-CoA/ethylmalonyl-CoA epimerase